MVKINGELKHAAGLSLEAYLEEAGYQKERIAVECNGTIIPKAEYSSRILQDHDEVEIVSFVGGG